MIRIVVDTNVIVSALVFGGTPSRVLQLVEAGQCRLFYSDAIAEEVRRVLREKFGWEPAMLLKFLPALWSIGTKVLPQVMVQVIADDPDDNRILECAIAAGASVVVSGDRDLLSLGKYKSTLILSPRQFLDMFFPLAD